MRSLRLQSTFKGKVSSFHTVTAVDCGVSRQVKSRRHLSPLKVINRRRRILSPMIRTHVTPMTIKTTLITFLFPNIS